MSPTQASANDSKPREMEFPVRYRGASLMGYICDAAMPAALPMEITRAMAMERL